MTEKTASDEILMVRKFFAENDEFLLKCPHCGRIRGIENETGDLDDLIGAQYEDNLCGGTYEVDDNPFLVRDVEKL